MICMICPRYGSFVFVNTNLLELQYRFGDKPPKFRVVCPQNGTAALKGLIPYPSDRTASLPLQPFGAILAPRGHSEIPLYTITGDHIK